MLPGQRTRDPSSPRALRLAQASSSGSERAVGRNASSGIEVTLLDDFNAGFQMIKEINLGDRDARDLAFGDVDGDGRNELLIARSGRTGSPAGRVMVVQDKSEGFAERTFADWPDTGRSATGVAIGDLEGDGRLEIAVGRSEGGGGRGQIYRYNAATDQYENPADWETGWE